MVSEILFVLGSSDPEMTAIEALLTECGVPFVYAMIGDRRVTAGEAYSREAALSTGASLASRADYDDISAGGSCGRPTIYRVECAAPIVPAGQGHETLLGSIRIDHHHPDDPGFGAQPEDFMRASSLGQVIAALALMGQIPSGASGWDGWNNRHGHAPGEVWLHTFRDGTVRWACLCESEHGVGYSYVIPRDLVLTAAADHCLGHAYAGRCPGVDPDDLMRFRVASRAKFQGRTEASILSDIDAAKVALDAAPNLTLAVSVSARDMRGRHVPELPEAGTRYGIAYVADGLPDASGRVKTVCSGSADVIRAFLDWAPTQGLVDCYGDPERGFAGAYLA